MHINEICDLEQHDLVLPAPLAGRRHPAFDELNRFFTTLGGAPYIEANLCPEYLRDWAIVTAEGAYLSHNRRAQSTERAIESILARQKIWLYEELSG